MKPILECGAFELAEQIRRQERSVEEVVLAHIEEIEKWNPKINAVVENRFSEALEEARGCDRRIRDLVASGKTAELAKLPPLFGVPFTIKEMISVKGFRHTLGSIHRKDSRRNEDGTVVKRLKDAGGILLGTTNVPELGFWFECSNPVYGRTNNPYDLSRTAGGSTGGEAAIIGAGGSPIGVGSDIGGSIRMPVGFCGIFGHKPSNKIVPMTGHIPIYPEDAANWGGDKYPLTVLGPLARKAADLYPMMQLLIGPDGIDPETKKNFKLKPRVTDWTGKKVWILPSPRIDGTGLTDKDIVENVRTTGRYFEAMGATLKVMRDDYFREAVPLWFASLTRSKGRSFTETLTMGTSLSYTREFLQILRGRGQYTVPGLGASLLEVLSKKNADKIEDKRLANIEKLDRMKAELNHLLGEDSILILPNHPRVAPKHGAPLLRPFDFVYTGIFNSLELPATAGVSGTKDGLPISVQFIAGEGQDHMTLSAAEVLESAFGGWKKASLPS